MVSETQSRSSEAPSFKEAFRFWLKLGFISFGGPAGQIAIMHTELVQKRNWISESRFLHALNYCMLLPGPEATQLAIYIGWLLHRTWGGIVAGALFVIPSMVILWGLSFIYVTYGNVWLVAAFFHGLKPAVLAIVLAALLRIGRKALKNEVMWCLAAIGFASLFFFKIPFPIVVFSSLLAGWLGGKAWPDKFMTHSLTDIESENREPFAALQTNRQRIIRSFRILSVWLMLWFLPLLIIRLSLGGSHVLFKEGLFFSKAAMVTFGGAYAVLPYVGAEAVDTYGWLGRDQMLDGLALAETTPGPLIMVLQFVGFLGAFNHPGTLNPFVSATLGAFITSWCTFLPCFLWIFLGAPYIEQLRANKQLACALGAVTSAIVGVILNLAVWFGIQTLFPVRGQADLFACVVATVALQLLIRWKWSVIGVVLSSGVMGIFYKIIFV
jgi:chromate transporter